jgi:uncharacterized membrane protein YqjE
MLNILNQSVTVIANYNQMQLQSLISSLTANFVRFIIYELLVLIVINFWQ